MYATGVCLLQPTVPAATLALFRTYILTPDGSLACGIPTWVVAATALTGAATVAVLVGGVLVRGGRMTLGELGWRRDDPARALGLGLLGAAAATAAVLCAGALFGADPVAGVRQMLGYSTSQRALFASVGLALALVEESLFRGNLQHRLAARVGLPAAYVLVAAFYAAWHFPLFHADAMLARLGQGLVYGALRSRDQPLARAATAHALCWAFVGLY